MTASWRSKEARGIIHSKSKGPRIRWVNAINPSLRAGDEMSCPSSISEAGGKYEGATNFSFLCLLFSADWMIPNHLGRAVHCSESTDSNVKLIQKYPQRHTHKQWLTWAPMVQSYWHIKLTITVKNLGRGIIDIIFLEFRQKCRSSNLRLKRTRRVNPGLYCRQETGEGNGNLLQYSCLENPMDRRAWQAIVHRAAKNWTRLSDFTSSSGSGSQSWLLIRTTGNLKKSREMAYELNKTALNPGWRCLCFCDLRILKRSLSKFTQRGQVPAFSSIAPHRSDHSFSRKKSSSLVAQAVKNLPAMQEIQVWSLGW